jgi:hypothetical protein
MRQSRFSLLGVALVVVPLGFAAVFGWRAALDQATMPLLLVAGLLTVLSGRVAAVELGGVRVSWRHILAAGYVLMAVSFPLSHLAATGTPSADDYVLLGAAAVTACCLLFFAFDVVRGGRHFEITPNVERVLGA